MSTIATPTPDVHRRRKPFRKVLERWAGYAALRGLQWLVCTLPARCTTAMGRGFGRLFYRVGKRDRAVALRNLARIFPTMTDAEREAMARRVFINFAKTAMEFLRMPAMRPGEIAQRIRLEGLEHLDAALAGGKGVLLLTAHFGNWEFGGLALMQRGYQIDAVSRDPELAATADLMRRTREGRAVQHLYPKQHTLAVMRALKQNRIVIILADQHDWRGTLINFMGQLARGSVGPATFARVTGAAIVPVRASRGADDTILIHFEPALALQPTADKAADIERWTQRVHASLEAFVRAAPDQWQWFHDRWRPDCHLK
jgi:Kdo2-lipid IVA lauroyltransferase/acyltransferase